MSRRKPNPGVSRTARISAEGLQRLEAQLARGTVPADQVLSQWISRYGDEARELLKHYGCYRQELES